MIGRKNKSSFALLNLDFLTDFSLSKKAFLFAFQIMQFNFTFLKNFLAFVEVFKKPSFFTLSCFTF